MLFMTSEGLLPLSAGLSGATARVMVNRGRSCCHFHSTAESHKGKNSSSKNEAVKWVFESAFVSSVSLRFEMLSEWHQDNKM